MGRLAGRGMPSRLGSQPSRLRAAPQTERQRNRQRYQDQPSRAWYNKPEWHRLKAQVLMRDGKQCQRTGVMLVGVKHDPLSAVVHHKIPHRGDPSLFWDIDNLELVSKQWHDSEGQKEDLNHDGH